MRSTNEQLEEIIKRSDSIREKTRLKHFMYTEVIASSLCLVLIVLSVYKMPGADGFAGEMSGHYGSLLLSGPALGFVVVGLLAFLLGCTVTLLSLHYKQYRSKGNHGDDPQ